MKFKEKGARVFLVNSNNFTQNKRGGPQNSVSAVSRRILSADTNTVRLSMATLFCILLGMFIIVTSVSLLMLGENDAASQTPSAFSALPWLSLAISLGGLVFAFLPCVAGVVFFARRTVNGERPSFTVIFEPFRAKRKNKYLTSVLLSAVILLRVAVIVLPIVCGILNLPFFSDDFSQMSFLGVVGSCALVLFLSSAALVTGVYISILLFFVPYLLIEGETGFFKSLAVSVRMTRGRKGQILIYMLSKAPNIILSVISFMVLWVFWAAPRMLVSYFVYCDSIADIDNE